MYLFYLYSVNRINKYLSSMCIKYISMFLQFIVKCILINYNKNHADLEKIWENGRVILLDMMSDLQPQIVDKIILYAHSVEIYEQWNMFCVNEDINKITTSFKVMLYTQLKLIFD